jgi:hypothetical protein
VTRVDLIFEEKTKKRVKKAEQERVEEEGNLLRQASMAWVWLRRRNGIMHSLYVQLILSVNTTKGGFGLVSLLNIALKPKEKSSEIKNRIFLGSLPIGAPLQ